MLTNVFCRVVVKAALADKGTGRGMLALRMPLLYTALAVATASGAAAFAGGGPTLRTARSAKLAWPRRCPALGPSCRLAAPQQNAPPGSPAVVILPGFGNAAVDYSNPFGAGFDTSISYALQQRGFEVTVMPLERTQWFNVLRGLFTLSFWLGTATPYEPSYGWYVWCMHACSNVSA